MTCYQIRRTTYRGVGGWLLIGPRCRIFDTNSEKLESIRVVKRVVDNLYLEGSDYNRVGYNRARDWELRISDRILRAPG